MFAYQMNTYEPESFPLFWGEDKPAGIAFYDDAFGEYLLKIDLFSGTRFCLKCTDSGLGKVAYQIDVIHKDKNGNYKFRTPVGSGLYHNGNIHIEIYALDKPLILKLNPKEDKFYEQKYF